LTLLPVRRERRNLNDGHAHAPHYAKILRAESRCMASLTIAFGWQQKEWWLRS